MKAIKILNKNNNNNNNRKRPSAKVQQGGRKHQKMQAYTLYKQEQGTSDEDIHSY